MPHVEQFFFIILSYKEKQRSILMVSFFNFLKNF